VVHPVGRLHFETEGTQGSHVRLDGAFAEVAAAGVGQLERLAAVQQRPEEHDHRAGAPRGLLVDVVEVELRGRDDLEVVVGVEPPGLHAQAGQHLEQAVDLLDPGDLAQRRASAVEQGRAEQRDPRVLGGLDRDRPGQLGGPGDPQVRGAGPEGDNLGVERGTDPGQHLQ